VLALLLSIITSGSLVLIFRFAERFQIPLLPLIGINYLTCVLSGLLYRPQEAISVFLHFHFSGPYLLGIIQGTLFILIFNLMGITAQRIGAAYTSLMGKISVVIPTAIAYFLFHDPFPWTRKIGFVCALLSLILIHLPYFRNMQTSRKTLLLLLGAALFVGSGIIDTNFKIYQEWFGSQFPRIGFTILIFGVAGGIGILYLLFRSDFPLLFRPPTLIAGILLGVVNFLSLVFLLQGLQSLPATLFFPANNIGIILFTALGEWLLFKTQWSTEMLLGLALASISIWLIVL